MRNFFGMFGDNDDRDIDRDIDRDTEVVDDARLDLRQEELDIDKTRAEAGEVILSKDVVEERKSVDVPVTHEEVVIERRALNHEPSDSPITSGQSIHIPVSEERVDVDKHTVVTGQISAHKHAIEETRHIDETLKREEAHVDTRGDANVISDEAGHHHH